MTKDEVVKKNLDLHAEWMKYVFEHPDVLDTIPKGAVLVILPEDDKELYAENYRVLEENRRKGIPVLAVTMKIPSTDIEHRNCCGIASQRAKKPLWDISSLCLHHARSRLTQWLRRYEPVGIETYDWEIYLPPTIGKQDYENSHFSEGSQSLQ